MSEPIQPPQELQTEPTYDGPTDAEVHATEAPVAVDSENEFDSVDEDEDEDEDEDKDGHTDLRPETNPEVPAPEQSDESDYDPTELPVLLPTNTSTNPPITPPASSSSAVESSLLEEQSDEEYDPTMATAPVPPQRAPLPPQTAVFPASSSSVTPVPMPAQPSTATTPTALDQGLLQSLTIRLLADPSFLLLTDAQKQQRIAGEYLQLQNQAVREAASASSHNNIHHDRPRASFRKPYTADPRAPHRPDLNTPLSPADQAEFKTFLKEESKYHSKYPHAPNSRVFVGNVPTNHMGKEALWRLFKVHGRILEVSLKTPYAFIQYAESESAQRAIDAESGIPIYDKVMSLEIAKKSRVEEMAGKRHTYRDRTDFKSRDRDYEREDTRPIKKRQLDVQIIIQPSADSNYARDVAREFENHGLSTDYMFQRPSQQLSELINEAAYSGVISVLLVHKPQMVDVQIYEKTGDGGVKFDEYVDLNLNDALGLVEKAKEKQRPSGGFNGSSNGNNSTGFGRDRGGRNQRDNFNNRGESRQRAGYQNSKSNRERPVPNRPLYTRNNPTESPAYTNNQNGIPQSLQNLTAEQYRSLGARLGYEAPSYNQPAQQQPQAQPQGQGQVPQSAIDQLLGTQPGAPSHVQSLLDSLTKMK